MAELQRQKFPIRKILRVFLVVILLAILLLALLFGIQSARSLWEIDQYKQEVSRLHIPSEWHLVSSRDQRNAFLVCVDFSCPQSSRTYDPGKQYRQLPDTFQQLLTEAGYSIVYHDSECGVTEGALRNSLLLGSTDSPGSWEELCVTAGVRNDRAVRLSAPAILKNGKLKNVSVRLDLTPEEQLFKPDSPQQPVVEVPIAE